MEEMEVIENKNNEKPKSREKHSELSQNPDEIEPLRTKPIKPKYEKPLPRFDNDGEVDPDDELEIDFWSSIAHKVKLTPRRGIIYLLGSALVILILFIIIIILSSLWPSSYYQNVCQSSECHAMSAEIIGNLNRSHQPCENFWEFACGGWLIQNPIPKCESYWSVNKVSELKIKEKIRTLINTQEPIRPESNSVDSKVKRFYASCMGMEYIEGDGEGPLKKIITTLTGLAILRPFLPEQFDFGRTLKILHGDYRVTPYFRIEVVPDPQRPIKSIIKISPDGLSLPDKSYYFEKHKEPLPTAYKYYSKDIVLLMGATSDTAIKFSEDLFEYERRIARVTPNVGNLTDPVQNYHKLTISQLKSYSRAIHWDDLLQSLFPQGTVNDRTQVLIPSINYIKEISNIISSTDKQILNNYLMWRLTSKYSKYLSKAFTNSYEIYRREATGSLESIPRWEFCVDETFAFFPHVINRILAENCVRKREKAEKIEQIFTHIKESFSNRLADTSRLNEGQRKEAQEKLRSMSLQIGSPSAFLNRTLLIDYYFPLNAQKDTFFENILQKNAFNLRMEQINLASPSSETPTLWAIEKSPYQITYVPSLNKIIIPETILQTMDLGLGENPDAHLPILYGTIGVQISESIATAFGPEFGLYWSNGVIMMEDDSITQEWRDLIETKRSCLSTFFHKIRLDDEDYLERTSLDTTIHLAGIQIALDAFKAKEFKYSPLPSLHHYSSVALFFIAYGQSQCSSSTLAFHDLEHSTFTSLSHDHRTKGLLRQLVGFTESIGCSKSSEMYADFSCGYVI